jgi:hypothetical protein
MSPRKLIFVLYELILRYSRVNGSIAVNTKTVKSQNKTFLNYEKFNENLQKKEFQFEFKDKENSDNSTDYIRSSSHVRFQFQPNLEVPIRHQTSRSKSVSNNGDFSQNERNLNSSKSQLVIFLFKI